LIVIIPEGVAMHYAGQIAAARDSALHSLSHLPPGVKIDAHGHAAGGEEGADGVPVA
jgi:hypothetical protein